MVDSELRAMLAHDERHWWYRGRRRVLRAQLDRLALRSGARALDAGCGSGRTLDLLAPYAATSGVDLNASSVASARARGHRDVRVAAIERLPYTDGTFDLITCLDVLEHVPDDVRALRELRRVARSGAALLVTVPAYPSLWSAHDEHNLHYRRYRRRPLRRAAAAAGWRLERDSHFNSLLLAPAAVVRLATRRAGSSRSDLERTPETLDRLLEQPMRAEAALLRRGGSLPFGLSIVALFTAGPVPARGRASAPDTGDRAGSAGVSEMSRDSEPVLEGSQQAVVGEPAAWRARSYACSDQGGSDVQRVSGRVGAFVPDDDDQSIGAERGGGLELGNLACTKSSNWRTESVVPHTSWPFSRRWG